MEPMALVGMVFTLIVLVMIGGFILLFPLSRQIAELVRRRLEKGDEPADAERIAALAQAVESLRDEVERVSERQEFTERLLEKPMAVRDDAG